MMITFVEDQAAKMSINGSITMLGQGSYVGQAKTASTPGRHRHRHSDAAPPPSLTLTEAGWPRRCAELCVCAASAPASARVPRGVAFRLRGTADFWARRERTRERERDLVLLLLPLALPSLPRSSKSWPTDQGGNEEARDLLTESERARAAAPHPIPSRPLRSQPRRRRRKERDCANAVRCGAVQCGHLCTQSRIANRAVTCVVTPNHPGEARRGHHRAELGRRGLVSPGCTGPRCRALVALT